MADDVTTTTAGARTRIDTRDENECRYWCRQFGVRPRALKTAVRKVGDRPEDVRRELQHMMNVRVDTTG
jgi:hypothetical protein